MRAADPAGMERHVSVEPSVIYDFGCPWCGNPVLLAYAYSDRNANIPKKRRQALV